MNNQNISTGKGDIAGYAKRAVLGTALPTDATTAAGEAFKDLGGISEDGLTNSSSPTVTDIKDWSGAVVDSSQEQRSDTVTFTLIEALNTEALKVAYGNSNVTGTDVTTGITIKVNNNDLEKASYVFDMILKNGAKKRIVIPEAKVTAVGDVAYTSSGLISYNVTLTCYPDTSGNTHYEYIKANAAV